MVFEEEEEHRINAAVQDIMKWQDEGLREIPGWQLEDGKEGPWRQSCLSPLLSFCVCAGSFIFVI